MSPSRGGSRRVAAKRARPEIGCAAAPANAARIASIATCRSAGCDGPSCCSRISCPSGIDDDFFGAFVIAAFAFAATFFTVDLAFAATFDAADFVFATAVLVGDALDAAAFFEAARFFVADFFAAAFFGEAFVADFFAEAFVADFFGAAFAAERFFVADFAAERDFVAVFFADAFVADFFADAFVADFFAEAFVADFFAEAFVADFFAEAFVADFFVADFFGEAFAAERFFVADFFAAGRFFAEAFVADFFAEAFVADFFTAGRFFAEAFFAEAFVADFLAAGRFFAEAFFAAGRFFAEAFFAAGRFFAEAFLVEDFVADFFTEAFFFVADFFAADFFAADFFAAGRFFAEAFFFVEDFFAEDFFAEDFFAEDFFAEDFVADFFVARFFAEAFFAEAFFVARFFAEAFFVADFFVVLRAFDFVARFFALAFFEAFFLFDAIAVDIAKPAQTPSQIDDLSHLLVGAECSRVGGRPTGVNTSRIARHPVADGPRAAVVSAAVSTTSTARRLALGLLAAAIFVFALALPRAADAKTFRLASLAPPDSAWGKLIQELASEVDKATKGKVKFKLFLGGKLGDEAKVSKKLGRGLDGAFFTGQGMGLLLPSFRVQELPFLIESYADADKVRAALWSDFERDFEKKTDYVLVGPGETGMVYVFSKSPITDVEQLKASKLWVWEGDKVASDTFKVFGVTPRPLDILTVVQQLKSGGIDTVYNSPAGAVALGWTGDLGYVSGRPFAYASGGFVLTKKAWKKIPKDLQPTVKSVVTKYGEKIIEQARKDNEAALVRLVGAGGGLKKVPIPDAKFDEFKKVGSAAWQDLAKNLDAGPHLTKARKALGK